MLNIEFQLRKDIIYHPEEGWHKMVYADWLEDQGRVEESDMVRNDQIYTGRVTITGVQESYKNTFLIKRKVSHDIFMETAKTLFNNHPIAEIEISDRRPALPIYRKDKHWFYIADNYDSHIGQWLSHVIHKDIVKYLTGTIDEYYLQVDYNTSEEAIQDLNQACVKYGRSLWEY